MATGVFGDCDQWTMEHDPPQAVVDSAAYKVVALLRGEESVNLTKEEAVALLCFVTYGSTVASNYLETRK